MISFLQKIISANFFELADQLIAVHIYSSIKTACKYPVYFSMEKSEIMIEINLNNLFLCLFKDCFYPVSNQSNNW